MAGRKQSAIPMGTLFRGVSELQRNTFTSNSPHYDRLDTDFIVGTAIRFFEREGYLCVWEHLCDDPLQETVIVASENPILQNTKATLSVEFRAIKKGLHRYWAERRNQEGVIEAEEEVYAALEKLVVPQAGGQSKENADLSVVTDAGPLAHS